MADFVRCPPPAPRRVVRDAGPLLSREFLAFCLENLMALPTSLAGLHIGRRPARRTMRAVAERLELQDHDAAADVVRQTMGTWWPAGKGPRPPEPGEVSTVVVVEDRNGWMQIHVPVDVFFGAISGDALRVKHGKDMVMITRKDGE